jgi:competence protein ComEA
VDPSSAPWRALESATQVQPVDVAAPRAAVPGTAIAAGLGTLVLVVVAFVVAFGTGRGDVRVEGGQAFVSASGGPAGTHAVRSELVVEVVGAVVRPGVYRMTAGQRVVDLIDAAGGYGPRVDLQGAAATLNLAAPLADGQQVRVPSRDDATSALGPSAPVSGSAGGLIDLNQATGTELESLPGIGPATAAKIMSARDEQPFTSVEELRGRSLVGEKTFEKVRDLVTVR